jgi:hypothetical protein
MNYLSTPAMSYICGERIWPSILQSGLWTLEPQYEDNAEAFHLSLPWELDTSRDAVIPVL